MKSLHLTLAAGAAFALASVVVPAIASVAPEGIDNAPAATADTSGIQLAHGAHRACRVGPGGAPHRHNQWGQRIPCGGPGWGGPPPGWRAAPWRTGCIWVGPVAYCP